MQTEYENKRVLVRTFSCNDLIKPIVDLYNFVCISKRFADNFIKLWNYSVFGNSQTEQLRNVVSSSVSHVINYSLQVLVKMKSIACQKCTKLNMNQLGVVGWCLYDYDLLHYSKIREPIPRKAFINSEIVLSISSFFLTLEEEMPRKDFQQESLQEIFS